MDEPGSAALRQIADAAWRETARLALSALSRRGGALGEAGRSLERTLDPGALPAGVAALARHFAVHAPEAVREELFEALDWELHTFRGGRKVETSHRLEAVEGVPVARAAIPVEQSGFGAEATAVDLDAPHSMGDLSRYANAYLGHTFVDDAIENARAVELHNGTAAEAMAALGRAARLPFIISPRRSCTSSCSSRRSATSSAGRSLVTTARTWSVTSRRRCGRRARGVALASIPRA